MFIRSVCVHQECVCSSGVQGGKHHLWIPPPPQLSAGLRPQQLPDEQRDGQHLDPLPANMVSATTRTSVFFFKDLPCSIKRLTLDNDHKINIHYCIQPGPKYQYISFTTYT